VRGEQGYAGGAIDLDMKRAALPSEYDSVRYGPHRPSRAGAGEDDSEMRVVYKSSQTMPEFLITYCAEEDNNDSGGGGHSSSSSSSSSTTTTTTTASTTSTSTTTTSTTSTTSNMPAACRF
jgi:hypothetical protein